MNATTTTTYEDLQASLAAHSTGTTRNTRKTRFTPHQNTNNNSTTQNQGTLPLEKLRRKNDHKRKQRGWGIKEERGEGGEEETAKKRLEGERVSEKEKERELNDRRRRGKYNCVTGEDVHWHINLTETITKKQRNKENN